MGRPAYTHVYTMQYLRKRPDVSMASIFAPWYVGCRRTFCLRSRSSQTTLAFIAKPSGIKDEHQTVGAVKLDSHIGVCPRIRSRKYPLPRPFSQTSHHGMSIHFSQ